MLYQKNLNCPECLMPLEQYRVSGIYLNKCSSCTGVWFDEGELEFYRLRQGRKMGIYVKPIAFEPFTLVPQFTCPVCSTVTLVPGEVGNLYVLCCNRCSGFFLYKQTESDYDYQDPALDAFKLGESRGFWSDILESFDGIGDGLDIPGDFF